MAKVHLIDSMRDAVEERVDREREIMGVFREDDDAASEMIRDAIDNNEVGDSRLFTSVFRGKYCFDHAELQWYRYENHYWVCDEIRSVLRDIDEIVTIYQTEERRLSSLGGRKDILIGLHKRIRELQTLYRRKHILELATAGSDSLGISGKEWDNNRNLLGCLNGVLNLRTCELNPGKPDDYIKTYCPTAWVDIEQDSPDWTRFINDVFGNNAELIRFIHRLMGYAISGTLKEHIFPIFYGAGRNGKGTLLETIRAVLGPFAGPVQPEILLEQKWRRSSAAPSPDIMALRGRRIVWGSETDEGNFLDTSKVKRLVGGDTLTGRPLYGKTEINFPPTHTLFLLTNHKPRIQTDDYAFWQRVLLVPFNVSFVDSPCGPNERKRDRDLPEKLRQESSGILAWLVRGLLYYRREKLRTPGIVRSATEDYRSDEDILGKFISERCVCEVDARIDAGDLYNGYKTWAQDNGLKCVSNQRFSKELLNRGFRRSTSGRHRVYHGVDLR